MIYSRISGCKELVELIVGKVGVFADLYRSESPQEKVDLQRSVCRKFICVEVYRHYHPIGIILVVRHYRSVLIEHRRVIVGFVAIDIFGSVLYKLQRSIFISITMLNRYKQPLAHVISVSDIEHRSCGSRRNVSFVYVVINVLAVLNSSFRRITSCAVKARRREVRNVESYSVEFVVHIANRAVYNITAVFITRVSLRRRRTHARHVSFGFFQSIRTVDISYVVFNLGVCYYVFSFAVYNLLGVLLNDRLSVRAEFTHFRVELEFVLNIRIVSNFPNRKSGVCII